MFLSLPFSYTEKNPRKNSDFTNTTRLGSLNSTIKRRLSFGSSKNIEEHHHHHHHHHHQNNLPQHNEETAIKPYDEHTGDPMKDRHDTEPVSLHNSLHSEESVI